MPESSPHVAIIVLIYNDALLGERAINSAINQTYSNKTIYILDNGSTDQSPEMISKFASHKQVKIVTNPTNERSEFACLFAMSLKEPFLSFLFSDDFYSPDQTAKQMHAFNEDANLQAVFSNSYFIDETGIPIKRIPITQFDGDISKMTQTKHLNHFLARGNSLHPCGMLIRSQVYKALGGFRPYMHQIGDMDFFTRLLCKEKVNFLPDRLQTITVWKSARNESALNSINHIPILIERFQVLKSLKSNFDFSNLEELFPGFEECFNHDAKLINSDFARLFWFGLSIAKLNSVDHSIFGVDCMIEAYLRDPKVIDATCIRLFKVKFSELCYEIENDFFLSSSEKKKKKIRTFLRRHLKF